MEQVGNPSVASRLKPVQPQSTQDWEVRRPIIEELYWTDSRKLLEVMDIMKIMHNFSATYCIPTSCDGGRVIDSGYRMKQYKDQFKRWNLEKNIKTDEMKAIIRIRNRRRDGEDKDTQFRLRKRPVPQEKIDRFVKRQMTPTAQASSPGPSSSAPTPSDISYYTPPGQDTPTPSGLGPPMPPLTLEAILEQRSLRSPVAVDALLLDYPLDLAKSKTSQLAFDIVSSPSNNFALQLGENVAPISSPPHQPRQKVVREKGKCLRCSLLDLECPDDNPCNTCQQLVFAVQSQTLWFFGCVRTRLHEVSIFEAYIPPPRQRGLILEKAKDLGTSKITLGFASQITWDLEVLVNDVVDWLNDSSFSHTSKVGTLSSPQFLELVKPSLDENISTDFQRMIYAVSLAYTQHTVPGKHLLSILELLQVGSLAGHRFLKYLDKKLEAQSLNDCSRADLQTLFLLITGTILAIGYTEPAANEASPKNGILGQVGGQLNQVQAMQEHLCQILAHYVLYFRWRLNLPIPHDGEPSILKGASSRWHKKGLFQWKATVEDRAQLGAEDWPAEDFLQNDVEGSLNSIGQDTGFSSEMPLRSPSNFECDAQLWSIHATSSRESFHTRTNIAPIGIVNPPVPMFAYLSSCQASNEDAFAQPQQPLLPTLARINHSCSSIPQRNHFAISQTEVPPWQWNENSQMISMDQFRLTSEEHMVVDVLLQTATNTPEAPNVHETANPLKKLHRRLPRQTCSHCKPAFLRGNIENMDAGCAHMRRELRKRQRCGPSISVRPRPVGMRATKERLLV